MKMKLLALVLLLIGMAYLIVIFDTISTFALPVISEQPFDTGPAVLQDEDAYLPVLIKHEEDSTCGAIQAALNALPASGGEVVISSGVFICNTALVIARDNVVLRGQGPSTVLSLAAGSNSPVLILGDTATPPQTPHFNIHVSDLTIDGNRTQQTTECWGGPCDSGGLTYIRNNGITLRGVRDVVVERVSVVRARSGGLVAEKGCHRITVRDFTAAENEYDGLAAYETEDSVFSGLYLHDNPYAGMSLDIDFNNNIVTEAVLADNGKQGIFMRDSRDNLFSNIQIRQSGEQGLFLAQVDANTNTPAAGNTFQGLVVTGSGLAGIRVNNVSCVDNLIVGAQFIDNAECVSEAAPGLVSQFSVICR
jgi:hypothetical protein